MGKPGSDDEALQRVHDYINRSAGQHRRAIAAQFAALRNSSEAAITQPTSAERNRKPNPKLRLIKLAPAANECRSGKCSIEPACSGMCLHREINKSIIISRNQEQVNAYVNRQAQHLKTAVITTCLALAFGLAVYANL